jgi:Recombinase
MRFKKAQGERVGNIAFGYQLCADGKHVEPNPAEQAVLARIRKLRAKGHTLRAIAEKLNRSEYRTRQGSQWRHVYVAGVLKTAA